LVAPFLDAVRYKNGSIRTKTAANLNLGVSGNFFLAIFELILPKKLQPFWHECWMDLQVRLSALLRLAANQQDEDVLQRQQGNAFFAPFYTKNDHFAKTGSGQT
jgi:hypothetical protein